MNDSIINDYCNESAVLLSKTDNNEYCESEFSAPVNIKCLKDEKNRLIKDKQGLTVVSNTKYTIPFKIDNQTITIKVDDKIDGSIILSVSTLKDLDRNIIGYEVYV